MITRPGTTVKKKWSSLLYFSLFPLTIEQRGPALQKGVGLIVKNNQKSIVFPLRVAVFLPKIRIVKLTCFKVELDY